MKCQLIITIDDDDSLAVKLHNTGKVSTIMIAGTLDLVKISLLNEQLDFIKEDKDDNTAHTV